VAGLREFSSTRIAGFLRKRRQHPAFVRFHFLPRLPALTPGRGVTRIIRHIRTIRRWPCFASPELASWKTAAVLNFLHCRQRYDIE
jgi:hypothetical protein